LASNSRKVFAIGNAQRLHYRAPGARAQCGGAGRRLTAVQLQDVRIERADDGVDQRIVGIDRQRDFLRTPGDETAQVGGDFRAHMARARRKEDEADHVGARLEGDRQRSPGRKAADFDDRAFVRHALPFGRIDRPVETCDKALRRPPALRRRYAGPEQQSRPNRRSPRRTILALAD
jgi:hypothetical protein